MPLEMEASLSECGQYRWWLRRTWGEGPEVCFVMLNPSTADHRVDDPTIRRCIGFAKDWGFGRLTVRNLYCFRSPSPKVLFRAADPIGRLRADDELAAAMTADRIVVAWGVNARADRVARAAEILHGRQVFCFGRTKAGQPRHPLYMPAAAELGTFLWSHWG